MTTLAMILGSLPLLFASGAGAMSRMNIGLVLVGGLTVGTMLSLFVVPVVYTLLSRRVRKPQVDISPEGLRAAAQDGPRLRRLRRGGARSRRAARAARARERRGQHGPFARAVDGEHRCARIRTGQGHEPGARPCGPDGNGRRPLLLTVSGGVPIA